MDQDMCLPFMPVAEVVQTNAALGHLIPCTMPAPFALWCPANMHYVLSPLSKLRPCSLPQMSLQHIVLDAGNLCGNKVPAGWRAAYFS